MRMHITGGFCVSLNASARQIVLMAHGSWSRDDGTTIVPNGTRVVHFYTSHREFGKRAAAYAVFAAGAHAAYQGLLDNVRDIYARSILSGPGSHTSVRNYSLSHLEGEDEVWNNHQAQRTSIEKPCWDADIDLMVIQRGHEGRLSDAFQAARAARGQDYEVLHCCHCRYVEPGQG
jgi:hypothetical protein